MLDFKNSDVPYYRLTTDSGCTFLVYKKDVKQAKMHAMKALKNFGNGGTLTDMKGEFIAKTTMTVDNKGYCKWTKW